MNGTSTTLSGVFAGRYTIHRELGRGGTAIVYLAHDQQRGHPVAIKVLRPEFAESIGADRFLKEIRVSQQLHHPQILPVLDSGKYEGQLYFVLPHMEGGTLRALIQREKQLPLEQVLAITRWVATALQHAHDKGLVHRDVKPENILFTSGQACLSDFGIARALERAMDESTTSTSIVRGTPPYMSPEQASGERDLDGRTDIYSLACVAYEMIAGIQPFVGPTPESVIAQRFTHAPRPLRVYRPSVPSAAQAVIDRALALTRADRYQTAVEFAQALERAIRTMERPRRWRAVVLAAGGVGAASLAVLLWSRRPDKPPTVVPGTSDVTRIAVRYFDAPPSDSQLVATAGGITRDLIDALRRVPALTVISPEGMRTIARTAPTDSVARALNVGMVVTGTLERRGDSMAVDVRLVNGKTLVDAANVRAVYPSALVVRLRDTLVQQVASQLRRQIGPQVELQGWRAGTRSRRAWELRQSAQQLSDYERDLPRQPSDFRPQLRALVTAESLLALAAREDPSWAEPLVEIGRMQIRRTTYVPAPWQSALLDSAEQHAQFALQRQPGDARALELRGTARYAKWTSTSVRARSPSLGDSAEADLRAAIIADRHLARAWLSLSNVLEYKGDAAGATDAARRAVAEDAFLRDAGGTMMRIVFRYLFDRKYDSARTVCATVRAQFREDAYVQSCELSILGWSGSGPRDAERIWATLEQTERTGKWTLVDGIYPVGRYWAAAVLARSGLRDSARAVLISTRDRLQRAGNAAEFAMNEAHVWLLLGRADSAMSILERGVARDPATRAKVARLPWFDELRSHPRYQQLIVNP